MSSLFAAALPWWQTWWLWALALVAAVAAVAAVAVYHRRRLRIAEELVRQRTAEVAAKQELLERQNKRLEVNNTIVKFVNARIGFSDLLQTILEGTLFVESANRALALAATGESDEFVIRAASGWSHGNPRKLNLHRKDIEESYLERAAQVAPGIWIGAPSASPLAAEEERVGRLAKEVLVMRIELDDDVAGYLVVHHLRDDETFDRGDLDGLEDLKDHMASAFLKGRMLEELRELNEKKNEFLGIAAHDLRNPLTGVIGYSDLLLRFLDDEGADRPRWRRFLNNIQQLADDMRTMVNQLLDVTAIETGKVEMCIERRHLSSLLSDCDELHAGTAREKGIDLELDTSAAAEVMMDRVRVAEVLDNLVSNAIKFTWPGGRVQMFCEAGDGEVVTHVKDNGQGLGPRELDEVFSGKRLSARPTAGEPSTGLGLVIVKKVVELHRGRIWVVSEKGVGSTFSFSLPAPQPAAPLPTAEAHAPNH